MFSLRLIENHSPVTESWMVKYGIISQVPIYSASRYRTSIDPGENTDKWLLLLIQRQRTKSSRVRMKNAVVRCPFRNLPIAQTHLRTPTKIEQVKYAVVTQVISALFPHQTTAESILHSAEAFLLFIISTPRRRLLFRAVGRHAGWQAGRQAARQVGRLAGCLSVWRSHSIIKQDE